MIEASKIVQALCYMLNKINKADKLKLVKLLYLADKYHLTRYGRTITNDEYWAMDYGPVGSTAKDVLSLDPEWLSHEFSYASKMLKKIDEYNFEAGIHCTAEDLDLLSESDLDVLNFITDKFGSMNKGELIEYTHRYPEWAQYRELFKHEQTKREKIETEELISTFKDDILAISQEHMEESRDILTGRFD